jgi:SAM-dependent MidA family methyltransferase
MSETLTEIIRAEIAASGPMTFRRFMELALYHPVHGYYSSGRARIGRQGDFFTNVSVGPLFGRLLARQVAEMWERLGSPAAFSIIEQGAYDGQLALDVLGGLREFAPRCFAAAAYQIIEPSPVLEALQRERHRADGKVAWHTRPRDVVCAAGVHLSNELADAFPVHLVVMTRDGWREQMVVQAGGGFQFQPEVLSSERLRDACNRIPGPLREGYTTEVNLAAADWISEVAASIARGFVLAIDYGYSREEYFAPARTSGTLTARASHRREPDPLARPGANDLTAHVEFSSLIEAGEAAGLRLAGFTDQHRFMAALGLLQFADGVNASEHRAFKTLMHPEFLGSVFKVICFSKGVELSSALAGFKCGR